ncbi:MAG: hypothetical protein JXJ22_04765 [Bacteroidales bacterium]|nr:hypothetical protein [Bacteroidales bacterium]
MKLKYLIVLFLSAISYTLYSQITSSPYSIFGIGNIETGGFGANAAMGGTGIAFKSSGSLNNLNPASYGGIDSLSVFFELGIFGKTTIYKTATESQNRFDANLKYLAAGFRVTRWWAGSFGIIPFSSVGYSINTTNIYEGTIYSFERQYTGKGGINKFYIGNSLKPFKNFFMGFHASYLFGSIINNEIVDATENINAYKITQTQYLNNFYLDYGIQYQFNLGKLNYGIGLTYSNQRKLKTDNIVEVAFGIDTISIEPENFKTFFLPESYGIGISVEKENRFRVGLDYTFSRWSAMSFSNPLLEVKDNERISVGMEYTPRQRRNETGIKALYYRIGGFYNSSYLEIENQPIDSKAITFGLGIPLRQDLSMINLSFELGDLGTTQKGLIREFYGLLHVNITLRDLWFMKRKIK